MEIVPELNNLPLEYYGTQTEILGESIQGSVYATDKGYALKILQRASPKIIPEIVFPLALHHPGIIKYHDVIVKDDYVVIVMDQYQ